ncbi:hypothetical protein GCM10010510_27420 [Streptomyces anandii JCM 4720]|nr:hypothetical protein GCM10010510_27420 [Streptomyces anandii JCM 4720]
MVPDPPEPDPVVPDPPEPDLVVPDLPVPAPAVPVAPVVGAWLAGVSPPEPAPPEPVPLGREPSPVVDRRDGEGAGERSPEEDGDAWWPVTAAPTVVPCPPPKRLPAAASYAVIPAMVTPKTSAAASTGRRHPRARARAR